MKIIQSLALSCGLLGASLCCGQNMLVSGGFELPGGMATNTYTYLGQGNTNLTGWTIGGTGGVIALCHGFLNFPPPEGGYHVTFNGNNGAPGTWLSQSFSTSPGATYLVTFQVGRIGDAALPLSLTVSALSQGGETIAQLAATPPASGYGDVQTFQFTATNWLTTLKVLDTSTGTTAGDLVLDNVSVVWLGCSPHRAKATALMANGFVYDAIITDPGCGYTNVPLVVITGGGGTGAAATAIVANGIVTGLQFSSAGFGYTNAPKIEIASPPFVPTVNIAVSRVNVTQNVVLGRKYLLESSADLTTWTPAGPVFTATSETVTNEFVVAETGGFFRIREVP